MDIVDTLENGGHMEQGVEMTDYVNPLHHTAIAGGVGETIHEDKEEEEDEDRPSWDTLHGDGRSIEDSVTSQMKRMSLEADTASAAAEPYVRDAQGKWVRRESIAASSPAAQGPGARRESSLGASSDRRDPNALPSVLGSFKAGNAARSRRSLAGNGAKSLAQRLSKVKNLDTEL